MEQAKERSKRAVSSEAKVAAMVASFDDLPDDARVRVGVVVTLLGISKPTCYRWVKAGVLPELRKIGGTSSMGAGELRAKLRAGK